jgi:hypothetical protein
MRVDFLQRTTADFLDTDMLLFVICGGLIFEALRLVFGFFG